MADFSVDASVSIWNRLLFTHPVTSLTNPYFMPSDMFLSNKVIYLFFPFSVELEILTLVCGSGTADDCYVYHHTHPGFPLPLPVLCSLRQPASVGHPRHHPPQVQPGLPDVAAPPALLVVPHGPRCLQGPS